MSPRSSLAGGRAFQRVYAHGTRARRDGVTVWVARAAGRDEPTRVGLAVRAGGAVIRNRVRRRLRAALARYRPAPGFEVVAGADAGAATLDFQELESHLTGALAAAGLPRRA